MIGAARQAGPKLLTRACPVCGSRTGEAFHTQRFVLPEGHPLGDSYQVVACASCGSCFADTSVPQESYDAFYSRFSKYDDAAISTGSGSAAFDLARLRRTAARILDAAGPCGRVLDIGCAGGGLLHELGELGVPELVGVDPSMACVEHGRQAFGLDMYCGTLADLPDLGGFDLVILSHVLEHVEDVGDAIEALRPHLAPGGAVYVEVPDAMRYRELLVAPFQDFSTEHINHFTAASLQNLAAHKGFVVAAGEQITIEATDGVPYPAVWQLWHTAGADAPLVPDAALRAELARYIEDSQLLLEELDTRLAPVLEQPVVVWGTGQLALKLLAETVLGDADVLCFVDANPVFHGTLLRGVPVTGPDVLAEMDAPIVIASTIHREAIVARIRGELGLTNPVITL